jgi:hypothetical protein
MYKIQSKVSGQKKSFTLINESLKNVSMRNAVCVEDVNVPADCVSRASINCTIHQILLR